MLPKPYNPVLHGTLENYLRERHKGMADNMFYGYEPFLMIVRKKIIIPDFTMIRTAVHPVPDTSYYINKDFKLQSSGTGHTNMSCMGAIKGIYDPVEILAKQLWSITGLKLSDGSHVI